MYGAPAAVPPTSHDTAVGATRPGARMSSDDQPARMPSTVETPPRSDNLVDKSLHGTRGNGRGPAEDMSFSNADENAADMSGAPAAVPHTPHDTTVGANRPGARASSDNRPARMSSTGETPSRSDNLVDKSIHGTRGNGQGPVEDIAHAFADNFDAKFRALSPFTMDEQSTTGFAERQAVLKPFSNICGHEPPTYHAPYRDKDVGDMLAQNSEGNTLGPVEDIARAFADDFDTKLKMSSPSAVDERPIGGFAERQAVLKPFSNISSHEPPTYHAPYRDKDVGDMPAQHLEGNTRGPVEDIAHAFAEDFDAKFRALSPSAVNERPFGGSARCSVTFKGSTGVCSHEPPPGRAPYRKNGLGDITGQICRGNTRGPVEDNRLRMAAAQTSSIAMFDEGSSFSAVCEENGRPPRRRCHTLLTVLSRTFTLTLLFFGIFSSAAASTCNTEICSAGTYGISVSSGCKVCPAGAYCPRGSDRPIECAKGMYSVIPGAGYFSCKQCYKGSFSNDDKRSTPCDECPQGYFQPGNGASLCFACSPGHYQDKEGQTECIMCLPGFYSIQGMSECGICLPGFYSNEVAMSSCTQCLYGTYQDKPGQWSCMECLPGRFGAPTNQAMRKPCEECPSGFFQEQKSSFMCFPCAPGEYQDKRGQTSCSKCEPGMVSGDMNASSCDECKVGQFANNYHTACDICGLGRYGQLPGLCVQCNPGTYQDARGTTSCSACPSNTYSSGRGQSSRSDCVECPSHTTTNGTVGNINVSSCICEPGFFWNPRLRECSSCPSPESQCEEAGTTLATLRASPGYYRRSSISTEFIKCRNANDCPGGLVDQQCRRGHTGVLCAVCAENFVRMNNVCSYCDAKYAELGFTGVAFGVMLLLVTVLLLIFTRQSTAGGKGSNNNGETASRADEAKNMVESEVQGKIVQEMADLTGDNAGNVEQSVGAPESLFTRLRILIGYTQICAALNLAFEIPWPPAFVEFIKGLTFINLSFLDVLAPLNPCALTTSFLTTGAVHMAILPISAIFVYVARIIAIFMRNRWCCCKKNRYSRQDVTSRAKRTLLFLIFLLYPVSCLSFS